MLHKAITAAAIGNATEWYDYGVYAVVATYLTEAFFPDTLGSLGTMLGFAVSFVLRPLGGMVWGPIGDRFGRKSVLVATIPLIAVRHHPDRGAAHLCVASDGGRRGC